MINIDTLRLILPLTLLGGLSLAQAGTCTAPTLLPSNPNSVYSGFSPVNSGNGTVIDTRNGLMWQRCAEGQTWNAGSAGSCDGSAAGYSWKQALTQAVNSKFVDYSDWRLPSVKELSGLLELCRASPAINDTVFPATPSSAFWSSSPSTYNVNFAGSKWTVSFNASGGVDNNSTASSGIPIRLVRNAQPKPPSIINPISKGRGSATLHLVAPTLDGGSPLLGYSASCTASQQTTKTTTTTGTGLILTVRGLKGNVVYACTATARNAYYSSIASAALEVTPDPARNNITPILMLLLD